MEKKPIEKLFSLILAILKRPAMYSVSKIEDIYLVIFGYVLGSESETLNTFHQSFRLFINEYFNDDFVSKNDFSWPKLIRFYSASDSHSLELFRQLFEQFVEKWNKEAHAGASMSGRP